MWTKSNCQLIQFRCIFMSPGQPYQQLSTVPQTEPHLFSSHTNPLIFECQKAFLAQNSRFTLCFCACFLNSILFWAEKNNEDTLNHWVFEVKLKSRGNPWLLAFTSSTTSKLRMPTFEKLHKSTNPFFGYTGVNVLFIWKMFSEILHRWLECTYYVVCFIFRLTSCLKEQSSRLQTNTRSSSLEPMRRKLVNS